MVYCNFFLHESSDLSSSLTFVEVEAYAKKESGCANTSKAIATIAYANIAKQEKVNLLLSGLIINPVSPWLGCIADRKAYDIGAEKGGPMPLHLLEVKVMKEGLLTSATLNICPPILVMSSNLRNPIILITNSNVKEHYQACNGVTFLVTFLSDSVYHCEIISFDNISLRKRRTRLTITKIGGLIFNVADVNKPSFITFTSKR